MDRQQLFWTIAFVLIGLSAKTSAQFDKAYVPNPEINAKVGYTTNFSCESFGAPISTCLWERKNKGIVDRPPILITFESSAKNGQSRSVSGYSYMGNGLDEGTCGIAISVVKDDDGTEWTCTLIAGSKIFRGHVNINILKKPTSPIFYPTTISPSLKYLVDPESSSSSSSEKINIGCATANGQPPPKYKWYIGDRELDGADGLGEYDTTNDNRGNTITIQMLKNYGVTWRDNGKLLKCVVDHEALSQDDPKEVSTPIGVKFFPRALDFDETVFVPTMGEKVTLAINIVGNSIPKIYWEVDGENIYPGASSKNGRYKALPCPEVEGVFACKFEINAVQEEDLQKIFMVHAHNELGRSKFELKVATSMQSNSTDALPIVHENIVHVEFASNSPNELLCRIAQSQGDLSKISWSKNEQVISDPERLLQDKAGRRSFLLFENVSVEDAGQYTCVVSNQTHQIKETFDVAVITQDASYCPGEEAVKRKLCSTIKNYCDHA